MKNVVTRTDLDFPWWKAFKTTIEDLYVVSSSFRFMKPLTVVILRGLPYTKEVFTGGTDSRFLREVRLSLLLHQTASIK